MKALAKLVDAGLVEALEKTSPALVASVRDAVRKGATNTRIVAIMRARQADALLIAGVRAVVADERRNRSKT